MSTVPQWVKELPSSDLNKQILLEICKAGTMPLATPREITFSIKNIRSKNRLKIIEAEVKRKGWATKISKDGLVNKKFWIDAQKQDYVIGKGSLDEDEKFFIDVADMCGSVYDGWFTEIK